MGKFEVSGAMRPLVEKAGLRQKPRQAEGRNSGDFKCPFCGDKGYHLNIDFQKGVFRCVRCGTGGGTLNLFARLIGNENDDNKTLYAELGDYLGETENRASNCRILNQKAVEYKDIECANDDTLNETFSKLLKFPYFRLTQEHKENLLKRGLVNEDIQRNGYRSIPEGFAWLHKLNCSKGAFAYLEQKKIAQELLSVPELKTATKEELAAGLVLAGWLQEKGCKLQGVPGFFRLGNHWAFRFRTPGMLIPTRDVKGRIVAIQVRTSNPNLRYMTVSAKGLPGAVTVGISRIHFPLSNKEIGPETKVFLTEGPLKADVALSLMHQMGKGCKASFAAVQGVNNKSLLNKTFNELKNLGCRKISICYDMDRVTNPFVAQATREAQAMIQNAGMTCSGLYWDDAGTREMLERLYNVAVENQLDKEAENRCGKNLRAYCNDKLALTSGEALTALRILSQLLYESHARGFEKSAWAWRSERKGIDDELLTQLKSSDVH